MLIHPATEKIVLKLRNPEEVTTVIPTARKFDFRGQTLVAIPHRMDETRVLRNLGHDCPSPIKHYYSWPGQFKPFHAQLETSEFLTLHSRAFVLNDMGTGKTLSTLWAWDYLRSIGLAGKMLVVSPLSTLERTWADEVFRNFPHLNVAVLYGSKEKRLKLLAGEADIYLINHDGIKVIEKELIEKTELDTIVVDEIASFRNASTGRWKSLNKICAGRTRVWGLTGTPTPNSPTDAWAQCRLIAPERVPKYFGAFRNSVMKQHGQFTWLARENATDIVYEAMKPAVRFTRDQCMDLPDCIYLTREAQLTPEQRAAYKDMKSKLKMEYEQDQVTAVNEAVKLSKLVQIACGVVYGPNGEEIVLPNEPRINLVKEIVEEAGTKTIVFVPFKSALNYVATALADAFAQEHKEAQVTGHAGYVAKISGDTTMTERSRIFAEFQQAPYPKVLVAQPAAMSHGLTLTAASTIVWYAPITSQETYSQANARITRPGQKHTQFIVNIEGTEVEKKIYHRLKTKEKMQGLLLSAVHDQ